jgi:prevent-host-death family protein
MIYMTHSAGPDKTPVAEAKAHFAEYLRQVEHGDSIVITRHGRSVAALISIELFEQVQRLIAAGPSAGLASVAGGWKGSKEVAEKALEYGRSAPRAIPELD